jgi:hypothetical protein
MDMGSYPAAKRTGQTETLMYAERERLYDRGLTRDQMNSLMERLQAKLGSKNKLGEAVYQRKNAASRIKQVMEGAQRYTDTVIDRIVEVAGQNGVPLLIDGPSDMSGDGQVTAENDAETASASGQIADLPTEDANVPDDRVDPRPALPPADVPDDRVDPRPALPPADVADEHLVVGSSASSATAPEDWLAGVRKRREQIVRQIIDHEEALTARRTEIARIEGEIERIAARRDTDAANIGEIDSALSILQTI